MIGLAIGVVPIVGWFLAAPGAEASTTGGGFPVLPAGAIPYVFAASLTLLAIAAALTRGWDRAATILIDGRMLYVVTGAKQRRVPRGTIADIVKRPRSARVELLLSSGRSIRITLANKGEAARLVRTLRPPESARRERDTPAATLPRRVG